MLDAPNEIEREIRRPGFNRAVHGARGLFAGAVLIYHVVNSGLPTWPLLQLDPLMFLQRTTEYGVELFFCISGFVIVGTLRRAAGPAAFMEDRAIRIYPVLWTTILVIVGLGMVSGMRGFDAVPAGIMAWLLPANLLGLPGVLPWPNFHPAAWSLSYELAFYGLCALAWALRRRLGMPAALILTTPAAMAMLLLFPRSILFLCGVGVALGVARFAPVAKLARHPLPFLLAFLLLWREIQELSWPLHINHTTMLDWATDWRAPLALLAFAAVTVGFAGVAAGSGVLGRVLRSPVLQFMGTISYSFYLWHPIVMSVVKQAMLRGGLVEQAGLASQLLFLLLSLPPTLLTAWVSQRVLERGAGAWLRRRLHHRASFTPVLQEPAPHSRPQPVPAAQLPAARRVP